MRPLRLATCLLLAALAAACSFGEPFVDRQYTEVNVQKPKPAGADGAVVVCYGNDTPRAKVDTLADEACAGWGLKAVLSQEKRWQCRLTMPHQATYVCIDPEMKFADGQYVNPFSKAAVEAWRAEQVNGPAPLGRKGRAAAKENAGNPNF
jgi:hypothetical protein